MKKHFKYLWYVVKHKWFLLVAALMIEDRIPNCPINWWHVLIHDWSKFSRAEWQPYVERFFGNNIGDASSDFKAAWKHHWSINPHHWEHWVNCRGFAREMPPNFVYEMVADWMAAGRAQHGKWDPLDWYLSRSTLINLHPKSRQGAEWILNMLFAEAIPWKKWAA